MLKPAMKTIISANIAKSMSSRDKAHEDGWKTKEVKNQCLSMPVS